ncbi:helix-turn-helix domain-containing protein, partial [Salibacterium aidingense]
MKDHMRIRDLKEEGFSIAAIARKCGVSRNTVYNYLEMDWDEALDWVETLKTRTRKLDSYKDYI